MRTTLSAIGLLALAACAGPSAEELAAQRTANRAQDMQACIAEGTPPGHDGHELCMVLSELQRQAETQAAAQRRRSALMALGAGMQGAGGQSHSYVLPGGRYTTCRTTGSTTHCF